MRELRRMMVVTGTILAVSLSICAQKAVMFDHDGDRLTDNEFVDIRMANPSYPDATIVKKLDDGTTEFRLPKIGQEGSPAPPFALKTIDGKRISSDELKGKVVVLNFWFIGCPACMGQEVRLNELRQKFAGTHAVFIAATGDSGSEVKKYLAKQSFDYIQAADAKSVIDAFDSPTYPRNIMIGRDGRIVYWRTVVHAWDRFESVIRTELAR